MRWLTACGALFALWLTLGAAPPQAAPLLQRAGGRADADERPTKHELRRARVTLNPENLVAGPNGTGTSVLTLKLFPGDEPLEARLAELHRRGRANFTWVGIVSDDPRSLVVLTAVGDYVDGTVLHHERMFRIKPTRSGVHYVIEVARNSFGDFDHLDPPGSIPPDRTRVLRRAGELPTAPVREPGAGGPQDHE
jgi:hypothetical protein